MLKKISMFLVSLALAFPVPQAVAQSPAVSAVQITQGKPIRVRYKSLKFKGTVKTVLIRDKNTGKRAMLALPLVNAQQGIYEGTFVILFDSARGSSEVEADVAELEVFPLKVTRPKTLAKTNLSRQNLVLLQTRAQEVRRHQQEISEAQKRAQLEEQARALSEQERLQRKQRAAEVAQAALSAYQAKNYAKATGLFKQAIEMDPENNKYYFQYGVSLFQQKQYQKSLVALSLAENGDFSRVDKNYFTGMNYYKLGENEKALKSFIEVRDDEDAELSAPASYYAGVLQFNDAKYGDAKTSFNYVLDNSKDPALDRSAESYLDKIDAIDQFNLNSRQKWLYSVFGGAMYDSNILNVAAANAPTDMAGFRALYGATLERRLIYNYFREWSVAGSLSDMYSTNTGLETKQELQNADPLVISLKSPIKFKTTLLGQPYSLLLTPGFDTIAMNADATGPRETILDSFYLNAENSFSHSTKWIGQYSLELRNDSFNLEGVPADDQTALKTSLGTTQIFIGSTKKSQSHIFDGFLINNNAKGENQKYNRLNLGYTYTQSFYWNSQMAARFNFGVADYPDHLTGRKDNDFGLSFSAQKPLGKSWSTAVSVGWLRNNSDNEAFAYDKTFISNVYTYSGAF